MLLIIREKFSKYYSSVSFKQFHNFPQRFLNILSQDIEMINDSMKLNKLIGMIQPISLNNQSKKPKLHQVGCLGKITSFTETDDGRYLIELVLLGLSN